MNKGISNVIDGLYGKSASGYGNLIAEESYKTIAGVRAKVDKDGNIIDEKAKKKIEQRIGKPIQENDK